MSIKIAESTKTQPLQCLRYLQITKMSKGQLEMVQTIAHLHGSFGLLDIPNTMFIKNADLRESGGQPELVWTIAFMLMDE